ncbi:hypothetical protein [Winogradskyella bathintestinalis]|uniref:Uncharacterized protein n=1 Tax=Winogradskyella bathintestinalis TaxID=3035208 RepID=A0ABT7ZSK2_9FLAO|nr:hypothetical protein [Winogradskyella bathintestinalis]MDN3491973.1 hypothetical protein [Winogradskyella bathintestinalis]
MIITKLLGLTTFITKSKKAKIAVLGIEIAVLAYALYQQKSEEKNKRLKS